MTDLDWLLRPINKQQFFQDYWEKQPLVVERNTPEYYGCLLSFSDVDRVITTLDRGYPNVVLKNADDSKLTSADYTVNGDNLDVAKVYQLFEQGSTITLAFLDKVLPALTLFCRNLENEFTCPFQTNVYMTPPGAQGAKPHYDTHDVFVLQVAGSKRWTIFGTPVESPLQSQRYDERVHDLGAATLEFELKAGDLAYIPRGVGHEARSTDTTSLHITTGILRYTWADLLLEVVGAASLENAALRKALPPGFSRRDFERASIGEKVGQLLKEAVTPSQVDASLEYFADRFMANCPPLLDGQMEQLARLDAVTLDSVAGVRPGLIYRAQDVENAFAVDTYGRRIKFPRHAREAVEFALTHSEFRVAELPGSLDGPSKVTLTRRLVREGLVAIRPTP